MASLDFTTLDVFTTTKFAGNPLAVVHLPTSTTLTQAQKQTIAREFNYSETVFLHEEEAPKTNDDPNGEGIPEWRLDIFTTTRELPFAGHPTIGSACHILRETSTKTKGTTTKARFKVLAGTIDLEYGDDDDGVAYAAIPHDTHIHSPTTHGLDAETILRWQEGLQDFVSQGDLHVDVVSPVRGMNFAFVKLDSLELLSRVGTTGTGLCDVAAVTLDEGWAFGPLFAMFYVELEKGEGSGDGVRRFRTRMIEGAFEDPATGSAACGLAAFLVLKEGLRDGRVGFEILQGVEMGRRSEIGVSVVVRGGVVERVVLSGRAVVVMQGKLFL